ncbi:MAG: nucleotidyltransferase family protein [Leptolyngbyaceae cyanobacterium RM2_2_4]|nr:nucleotidyltransferase family protein [Leptolyngbyaceae cyanobacterium RM2_2_4]
MLTPDVQDILINRLGTSFETIAEFCQRWKITEFALFGSVLRDDFRPDSDIDVLVTFAPDDGWSLFDLMNLQRELESMVGRRVDLLEKRELKNPFRRAEILRTHRVIHAS